MIDSLRPGESNVTLSHRAQDPTQDRAQHGPQEYGAAHAEAPPRQMSESVSLAIFRRRNNADEDAEAIRDEIARIDEEIAALRQERTALVRELASVWSQG